MSIRLIYHTDESMRGGVSPFDEALMTMTPEQDVWIACPYLDVAYLQRYIKHSRSWHLLTDIQAWVSSQPPSKHQQVQAFIEAHAERIHHCRALHAKVVMAGTSALVGSANLTKPGILRNMEASVFAEDEPLVGESHALFQELWAQTESVDRDILSTYIREVRRARPEPVPERRISLPSKAPPIRAVRVDIRRPAPAPPPASAPPVAAMLGAQKRRACATCGLAAGEIYPADHPKAGQTVRFYNVKPKKPHHSGSSYCTYCHYQIRKRRYEEDEAQNKARSRRSMKYLKKRPEVLERAQKAYSQRQREERAAARAAARPEGAVSLAEAAEILNVSRQWIHQVYQAGKLEATVDSTSGTRPRLWFKKEDIERIKDEREQRREQQAGDQEG